MKTLFRTIRGLLIPVLAAVALVFATVNVMKAQQPDPPVKPPVTPASAPFANTVAGAGMIEPSSETISIGTPLPGVVAEVSVKVGVRVQKGDLLFRVDDRQFEAERRFRKAMVAAAEVALAKFRQMPRPEEKPGSEARVREAEANWKQAADKAERDRSLIGRGAVPLEESVRTWQLAEAAKATVERTRAEHAMLLAGAWSADIEIQLAAVEQARAQLRQVEVELERLRVTAPIDGEILQVNVRAGEFVGASPGQGLVLLGETNPLHVRIDIDEHDIPRFKPGLPAIATVRGSTDERIALRFQRIEPYVIPKKSLTGDNTERVDTRVLQVIYVVEKSPRPLFVGQQIDASIDLKPAPDLAAGR
jgi:multidrug resistance efflux pump